ncbi:MAG: bifunctional phosphoribosylaminoimidazolecarboxamide formyltransferase/IMP cyclohydrolase [Elusimicrobiota bacterium]
MQMTRVKTVLISVSDKTEIIEFAKELIKMGMKIISTGGTAKTLKDAEIPVATVDEITDFPEILDGRVKTLHPKIHGGILAKRTKEHLAELSKLKIDTIDMVVVNLYPFEEKPSIENIDIGGVTLLRAAAKNFESVLVVCDPKDYSQILTNLKNSEMSSQGRTGSLDPVVSVERSKDRSLPVIEIPIHKFRKQLAAKAFRHTAYYDSVISNYFTEEPFTEKMTIGLKKIANLRYGENPHQKAAIYQDKMEDGRLKQLQGKELSYNNYLDMDAAFKLVCEFQNPTCVIVKHNNPCGVASAKDIFAAYKNALACDPVSAFGGVIAFNKNVDGKTAKDVIKIFTECIIAPAYSNDALQLFAAKKNLRILVQPLNKPSDKAIEFRSIGSGFLVQEKDNKIFDNLKTVTKTKPTKQQLESLKFAFTVAKCVKSNTIVLVQGTQTVGIGAGQMSRIDSLKIANLKMQSVHLPSSIFHLPLVLASDAFFPFGDVPEEAAKIGVKAIIQPGGSLKDDDSITVCNEHKISMVFTGMRHFRH